MEKFKQEMIQRFVEYGKRHRKLKAPVIAILAVCLTAYYMVREAGHKLLRNRFRRRLVCGMMAAVILLVQTEITGVFAFAQDSDTAAVAVAGFEELPDEVKEQTVSVGTAIDELEFPSELIAYIAVETEENGEVSREDGTEESTEAPGEIGAGENVEAPEESTEAPEESGTEENTENLEENSILENTTEEAVGSSAETGANTTVETVTVELAEYYAEPDVQTVSVLCQSDDAEDLPEVENVRQFPVAEVSVTVTWQSAPEYDKDREGTYIFTPALPEGYALAEGVSLPEITVTVENAESDQIQLLRSYTQTHMSDGIIFDKAVTAAGGTLSTGNYYLTRDTALSANLTINGTVNLCLNGYKLTGTGTGNVITVNGGAVLNLYDCTDSESAEKRHYYTYDANGKYVFQDLSTEQWITGGVICGVTDEYSSGISVLAGGTLNMYSGTVAGNAGGYGGGISSSGTLNLYGGSVEGNTASGMGGGVLVSAGTANLSGGKIAGNHAYYNGGGVYVNGGTFSILSGELSGNTSYLEGGGVFIAAGAVKMSGGTISGNTAKGSGQGDGGGVYLGNDAAVFTMTGGVVSDNTATHYGGGIACRYNAKMNIGGDAVIKNNEAGQYGGGIFYNKGTLNLSGGKITGNEAQMGGGINVNTASCVMNISGTPTVTGNTGTTQNTNNILTWAKLNITGELKDGEKKAELGIWSINVVFTSGYGAHNKNGEGMIVSASQYFSYDNGGVILDGRLGDGSYEAVLGWTVTFVNGSEQTGKTVIYGQTVSSVTLEKGHDATNHYSFDGWMTTEGGSTPFDFNAGITENKTVYAKFTASPHDYENEYDMSCDSCGFVRGASVVLNGNGGSGTGLTYYLYGTGVSLPSDWTKAGYTFDGWYENAECTGNVVTNILALDTGNKEYWAKWVHVHSYVYSRDAGGHWKECSRCGTRGQTGSHVYDSERDATCNICDYKRTVDNHKDDEPGGTEKPTKPDNTDTQPTESENNDTQPIKPENTDTQSIKPESTDTQPTKPDNGNNQTGTEPPSDETQPTENTKEQTIPAKVDDEKQEIIGEKILTGTVTEAKSDQIILTVGEGAVIVTVVCEEEKVEAGVADTIAVANAVLTPEQIRLVDNGETIEIRVDVNDISDLIEVSEKQRVEAGMEEYQKEMPDIQLGMYIDISMFIKVGGGNWNAVTRTDEPIEVIISIPEELRGSGRKYYVIRSHDGETTLLNDLDDTEDTITISTELFSTYAIVYEEGTAETDTGRKCSLCHICPTFLGICCFIWLLHRKKRQEKESGESEA